MLAGVNSDNNNICIASSIMSDCILDTSVKISWIEQKFLEGHPQGNKIHLNSWSAEITGENKGFASFIIRLSLNWSEDDENLPKSVILKCPTDQNITKLADDIIPEAGEVFDSIGDFIPMVSTWFIFAKDQTKIQFLLLFRFTRQSAPSSTFGAKTPSHSKFRSATSIKKWLRISQGPLCSRICLMSSRSRPLAMVSRQIS